MSVRAIPNSPDALDVRYRIVMDGSEYLLRVRYGTRTDRWYVELYDGGDELIAGSLRVIPDVPFWSQLGYRTGMPVVTTAMIPQGFSPDQSPPKFGELGFNERIQMILLEADA